MPRLPPHDLRSIQRDGTSPVSTTTQNAAKLFSCSPTLRSTWKILADAAIPSRRIPTATTFSVTATASCMPALFAGLRRRRRCSPRRYSDHFRNRLTHTIEVAQISRTIACATRIELRSGGGARPGTRCRPPSVRPLGRKSPRHGHAPARVIVRSQLARFANCRRLRTPLRRFSRPESDLRRSVKASSSTRTITTPKIILSWPNICSISVPPLEAQLIDLTDEIAYNTADLDDGL